MQYPSQIRGNRMEFRLHLCPSSSLSVFRQLNAVPESLHTWRIFLNTCMKRINMLDKLIDTLYVLNGIVPLDIRRYELILKLRKSVIRTEIHAHHHLTSAESTRRVLSRRSLSQHFKDLMATQGLAISRDGMYKLTDKGIHPISLSGPSGTWPSSRSINTDRSIKN